jgi:hypothetical protein
LKKKKKRLTISNVSYFIGIPHSLGDNSGIFKDFAEHPMLTGK